VNIDIKKEDVAGLRFWFHRYVKNFRYEDSELQQHIDLKEQHTLRVCREILNIGMQLGLSAEELNLAETVALLHDIGRFKQYDKYRTFSDRRSEDHAALGIKVLIEEGVLEKLEPELRELIFCIIDSHNKPVIPSGKTEQCVYFSKMLRDADKLDIFRILTSYYKLNGKRNGTLILDLPDTPGFSEDVCNDLLNKHIVNIRHVQNLNDFKLLQLGWIFDVNFIPTADYIRKNNYLESICDVLPDTKEVTNLINRIFEYRDEKFPVI
jgi:putative nucleotidyltransferase with HDIG domain